jgi:hypothetical protein
LLGKLRNLNFDIFCKKLELGKLKPDFGTPKMENALFALTVKV